MTHIIKLEDIYHDVLVHFGEWNELEETLQKYFGEEDIQAIYESLRPLWCGECEAKTVMLHGKTILVMPRQPDNAHETAALVHELYHALNMIMERIGVTYSAGAEEIYAYLLQSLTEKTFISFCLALQPLSQDASPHTSESHTALSAHHELEQ